MIIFLLRGIKLDKLRKKELGAVILTIIIIILFVAGCIMPTTYMVEMRDGIKLATDVYVPKTQSLPHGSILIRTPYNKNPLGLIGMNWAKNGWPTVIQDMRGKYASDGIDTVFRNAHTDGPDTLEWIADQSWSNGKVATYGGSALGINQYYMAGANPPNLACQFIQVATPNLYKHVAFQGGQFRQSMVERWLTSQGSLHVLPELFAHENYTLDYWTNVSLEDNWEDVNVPAIHFGGWFDCMLQGTIDGFMGYQYLGGTGAQENSKLIIGPWTHGGGSGELTYPENSKDTFSMDMFWDMVNQFTMNSSNNYDEWPTVSYYVLGDVTDPEAPGNEWRYADVWPLLDYSEKEWYLHENEQLSLDSPGEYDSLTYTYDPSNPVPTVGGQNLNIAAGPYDQTSIEGREDVLIFTSGEFEEPYEATGPIKARLYVSSNCPDTDFTVKLTDVYPDGRSMLIADGILRMRNRNGFDHWEFMEPEEIYEIEVDLWSTSYIWNTGHKIRVAISSSNYPRFQNNPNTEDPMRQNTTYSVAENTLYFDSSYPSCIILPEVEQVKTIRNPPNVPDIISAPIIGKAGKEYIFEVKTTDQDNDNVYYLFDWGDGKFSGWVGPYHSEDVAEISHNWENTGKYKIRVKSKYINGYQSDWSEYITINLPVKSVNIDKLKTGNEKLLTFYKLQNLPFFIGK